MMKITDGPLEGIKIIEPQIFRDARGFFLERFNLEKFKAAGLPCDFFQDNHSFSHPRVLRGLHFQTNPAQGKLVGVVRGKIWDVVVDIRPNSKTFLKYFGLEIDSQNPKFFWIPGGFAHGFCVISKESADVIYKVDAPYNPKSESGLMWNDPELAIPWPIDNPILAERDKKLLSVADYKKLVNQP